MRERSGTASAPTSSLSSTATAVRATASTSHESEYKNFEERVHKKLVALNTGTISDADIRVAFMEHTQEIISHYAERKSSTNSLPNYHAAVAILHQKLASQDITVPLAVQKIIACGFKIEKIASPIKEIVEMAKKDNPPNNAGIKPLISITCDAERDFFNLIIKYMQFFKSKDCTWKLKSWAVSGAFTIINKDSFYRKSDSQTAIIDYKV